MKSILKYIMLTAIRDRLYIGLFLTLITSFSLSIFLGTTALVEKEEMATSYIAGSTRIILAIGMILFVCLSVNRAFENKEVEFIISKSISRQKFILAYIFGFFLVSLAIFLPLITTILIFTGNNKLGLGIWSLSIFFELLILISFCLLASLILKNSLSSIMAGLGFYILSRMMGLFVLTINLPQNLSEVKGHFFKSVLKIISFAFPRLDLFGQTEWLIYGIKDFSNVKIIVIQSLIYIPLMIFMAFHDFSRKQF
jgi:ABC-type transport system involved in multi-copper enzyme maturation permease subunit